MKPLRLALLADGTSDRALIPIVRWQIQRRRPDLPIAEIAFEARGGAGLLDRMQRLIERERPEILLVHRDAEDASLEGRREEIPRMDRPLVRVVPVRMTEAWLLLDVQAIRIAAGNPNGQVEIRLPPLKKVESLPDPKQVLRDFLLVASERRGRRRKRLMRDLSYAVQVVADSIQDFTPLEALPAFRAFLEELDRILEKCRPDREQA